MRRIHRVVSGGQSGVDRAGLDAAIAAGVEYGGWCPAGGWAEDYPSAPGVLADYPGLREAPGADPSLRTYLNVRDSHATLVIGEGDGCSRGTDLTIRTAGLLGRPVLQMSGDSADVEGWLSGLGYELTLNVAGPRESEQPGIYARARVVVGALLKRVEQVGAIESA